MEIYENIEYFYPKLAVPEMGNFYPKVVRQEMGNILFVVGDCSIMRIYRVNSA
jgi:hypothetical protein